MAEETKSLWQLPLKVPAVEIVDLLSDDSGEMVHQPLLNEPAENRDASGTDSESSEDSQWSLYEDALLGEEEDGEVYGSELSTSYMPHARLMVQ